MLATGIICGHPGKSVVTPFREVDFIVSEGMNDPRKAVLSLKLTFPRNASWPLLRTNSSSSEFLAEIKWYGRFIRLANRNLFILDRRWPAMAQLAHSANCSGERSDDKTGLVCPDHPAAGGKVE